MMVVGLTGGIGSGKTSVLQLFKNRKIPVYIADLAAKKLMQSDAKLISQITAIFGKQTYKKGRLNRAYLAKQVFGNSEKLKQLNAIVHPAVHLDFEAFIKKQNTTYLIYENAILFENGSDSLCDIIITVIAPLNIRIERVVKRDKVTIQQVKDRMQHQWDDALKAEKSDFVIENIDWETTKKRVAVIHKKLVALSKEFAVPKSREHTGD